jgi:transposase InsO family protein
VQLIAPPNAFGERYMRSIKSECLSNLIFFGEKSLRRALCEFSEYYHTERNHQELENNTIDFSDEVGLTDGPVQRRERLGGMLSFYHRAAA